MNTLAPEDQQVSTVEPQRVSSAPVHSSAPGPKRVPELDGVRGVAILMVLCYHGFAITMQSSAGWGFLPRLVFAISDRGWVGVDLFFVLSGYLITGILLNSRGKSNYFKNFYARRALRIWPLYYSIVILTVCYYRPTVSYTVLSALYLANIAPALGIPVVYFPIWSLAVEEQFYMMWPWVVSKVRVQRLSIIIASALLLEPLVRLMTYGASEYSIFFTWNRFDGLAAGSLLAILANPLNFSRRRLFEWGLGAIGIGTVLTCLFSVSDRVRFALTPSCVALLFVGMLAVLLSGEFPPLTNVMRLRWLRYCGELSYFLYLSHWFIFDQFDYKFGIYPHYLVLRYGTFGTVCIRMITVSIICFFLAELSRRYFEGPILRLKRYF